MILNFSTISEIFSNFLKNPQGNEGYRDMLENRVSLSIKVNKILWDLEDSARMTELGDRHVAETKRIIDLNNQNRHDLIREIDIEIVKRLNMNSNSPDRFYSETPGMIVDRLSIIFIKLSIIKKLLLMMKEDDLKTEYKEKERVLLCQIKNIGDFYDLYLKRLLNGEVFFEIQQPIKIYNDIKIKEYIGKLQEKSSI